MSSAKDILEGLHTEMYEWHWINSIDFKLLKMCCSKISNWCVNERCKITISDVYIYYIIKWHYSKTHQAVQRFIISHDRI